MRWCYLLCFLAVLEWQCQLSLVWVCLLNKHQGHKVSSSKPLTCLNEVRRLSTVLMKECQSKIALRNLQAHTEITSVKVMVEKQTLLKCPLKQSAEKTTLASPFLPHSSVSSVSPTGLEKEPRQYNLHGVSHFDIKQSKRNVGIK